MNKNNNIHKKEGFALLLALIISSVALALGLSMLQITLKQMTLGTTTKGSEVAFQVANAGMECLRFVRSEQSSEIEKTQGTINVDCFDAGTSVTDSKSGSSRARFHSDGMDWTLPGGENACVAFTLLVLNDDANDISQNNIFGTGKDVTCRKGFTCTYATVQGFNRSCATRNSSIFTVQRELTLGF